MKSAFARRLHLAFTWLFPILSLTCVTGNAFAQDANIPLPVQAVSRITSPQILIAPDRLDWTYEKGEPVRFKVTVVVDGQALPGASIRYRVGPEKFEGHEQIVSSETGNFVIDGGTLDVPGFIRCFVEADIQGNTFKNHATAGVAPLELVPTQSEPADFETYWNALVAELGMHPLNLQKKLLQEYCTAGANVYLVSYDTWSRKQKVSRFYGVLTEPVEPGQYPVALRVPGAGVSPYSGEANLAEKGLIVLQLGIHGIPLNLEQPLYQNLRYGALDGYWEYDMDDKDRFYYQRVYLGCLRGIDVLTQHPSWDGSHVVVYGGSQGGQLSIVVSALDKRVTGTVTNYPAFCDVTAYLQDRAGGWPHMFADGRNRNDAKIETTAYYDTVNFARHLHAPISLGFGYNDLTCPPTSVFAAYHEMTVPKELQLELEMGHRSSPSFENRYIERILKMAGIGAEGGVE